MTDSVPGGSVHCLAASEKLVYGSGGGKLFALDPETEQKSNERSLDCTAILIAADGMLVVATSAQVQGLDPRTLETVWTVPFAQAQDLKEFHRLVSGPSGALYGTSDVGIFLIEPRVSRLTPLTKSGSRFLAADKDGRLYFAQGADLWRYVANDLCGDESDQD